MTLMEMAVAIAGSSLGTDDSVFSFSRIPRNFHSFFSEIDTKQGDFAL